MGTGLNGGVIGRVRIGCRFERVMSGGCWCCRCLAERWVCSSCGDLEESTMVVVLNLNLIESRTGRVVAFVMIVVDHSRTKH